MKTLVFILILLSFLVSCNDTLVEPKEPIEDDTTNKYPNCPHYDYNKYYDPVYDDLFSISRDGKYAVIRKHFDGKSVITVADRFLLNLQTGEYILVGGNENGKLGGTGRAFEYDTLQFPILKKLLPFGRFQICPYNSSIICFVGACGIDTVGDNKDIVGLYNLLTYNIETKEMKIITPSSFGKLGQPGNGFTVPLWLESSTEGNDKFLLGTNDEAFIYSQHEDKLEKISLGNYTIMSNDLSKRFYVYGNGTLPNLMYVNDKQVFLSDSLPIKHIQSGSFSQDKKLLALFVWAHNGEFGTPSYYFRNAEIWVMEVDKLIASTGEFSEIRKIKPRTSDCHYFTSGCFFTPQNTLIVGLHPYNNSQANIYEMDLKGNILRKITNN